MRRARERGQILPLAAIMMTALLLLLALVLDGGLMFVERRLAQNGADFAALAGARIVSLNARGTAQTDAAVRASMETAAARNGETIAFGAPGGPVYTDGKGIDLAGPVYVGGGTLPSAARGVRVAASRSFRPFLLGLIGISTLDASADAIARSTVGAQPACAFCVIGTSPLFTMQSGQTWLTVNGGAIGSNAGLDCSANANLLSTGTGSGVTIYGQRLTSGCPRSITPSATALGSPIPDPLAFLPNPTLPAGPVNGPVNAKGPHSTTTISPGIYQGMTVSANATLQLNPGTYYLTGDLSIQSNGTFIGNGVTLVFMGPQTSFLPQSNSTVTITAPSPTLPVSAQYPFPGMAMYFARDNKGTLQMQSSSTTSITGTIYAINSSALLDMQSGTTTTTINSMVVVGSANLQSSSKLTVNYDSTQNVQLPAGPPSLVK